MRYLHVSLLGLIAVLAVFSGGPSLRVPPASANSPLGNLSVDASPGDNTASSVGTIGTTADVTDACSDTGDLITVELVIGDSGTQDGVDETGGIPSGNDIAGWQARIEFDPDVLTFVGFLVSDSATGAGFYMEKASDHTLFFNQHITVVFPVPAPGIGVFDIGSAVLNAAPGANGVGLLARLFFDCVAAGTTSIDIGDGLNSFFTDITIDAPPFPNHLYLARNSASLRVVMGVLIDVKPGSDPNSTNLGSTGVIPVAVLTTNPFDAATIDPATVDFEGASPVHDRLEDVDGDSDLDLIMHFRTQDTNIADDATEACLTGETFSGQPIEGCDTIRVVPPWLDSDGDGFGDAVEATLGTDQFAACSPAAGHDAWPPDPAPEPDGNGAVQVDDVSFASSLFGTQMGDAGYTPRAEIASQNGAVQVDDVTAFASRFGQSC